MTRVLDLIDRLPVMGWALVVLAFSFSLIGAAASVEWVVITAIRAALS